jgi:hypothetical protein
MRYVLEGVGHPVGDEACYTPLSSVPWDWIKIFVRPVQHQYSRSTAHLRFEVLLTIVHYPLQKPI